MGTVCTMGSPTEEGVLSRLEEFAMSKTFVFLVTLGFFLTIGRVKPDSDDTPDDPAKKDEGSGDTAGDPPKEEEALVGRPAPVSCGPFPCCCTDTCKEKTKEEHEKEDIKSGECGKWGEDGEYIHLYKEPEEE